MWNKKNREAQKGRERIIVPLLWRFGKLNFTYLGSLRHRRRRGCQSRRGYGYHCLLWHLRLLRHFPLPPTLAKAGVDEGAEVDEVMVYMAM